MDLHLLRLEDSVQILPTRQAWHAHVTSLLKTHTADKKLKNYLRYKHKAPRGLVYLKNTAIKETTARHRKRRSCVNLQKGSLEPYHTALYAAQSQKMFK